MLNVFLNHKGFGNRENASKLSWQKYNIMILLPAVGASRRSSPFLTKARDSGKEL